MFSPQLNYRDENKNTKVFKRAPNKVRPPLRSNRSQWAECLSPSSPTPSLGKLSSLNSTVSATQSPKIDSFDNEMRCETLSMTPKTVTDEMRIPQQKVLQKK